MYFQRAEGAPEPLSVTLKRRVRFSETDSMGIVWYGRYPAYFEEGAEELGRVSGLSYENFQGAALRAPIAELHIDYLRPLGLDEEFTITASMHWHEGSRLNTEYRLTKQDGTLAASGYTVQLLTDAETGKVRIVSPELLEECRRRWKEGRLCKK